MNVYEIIFDCETKKFFDEVEESDPSKLGVSIVSAYFRELKDGKEEKKGQMKSFWENDLPELFREFQKADRIIGFNSIGFDVPALSPYFPAVWPKLSHFDMLVHLKESHGKRMSLNSLAKGTLGSAKNDTGDNAIKYWNAGDSDSLAKLKKYCEMDVAITRDLYDFGRQNGHLDFIDFWNEKRTVKVDFGYPKKEPEAQGSLF